ncbi:MAG TPA: ornithine cyclodeaminase family protein [Candidatus Dorea gallistercoris]|uniref:Ornithine cyclodeaminase family protein n=1 Tax=Candidatus Dorea gallistercoris TaxID=2838542 RepID=A0A9D1UEJ6_9FIRM|nr:ornithine cyclodeaminase family protein [Candidatus Dorea gallistercoris]
MILLGKDEIEKLADPEQMMDEIEHAYEIIRSGEYYVPNRPSVEYDNKTLMYMPCYTRDAIGTKILTIFPDNVKQGLPSIDGVVLLNDPVTGAPQAILDGQAVTAYRTGAIGGVSIRHLARKDCHTVGVVGAGVQGFYQALYACAAREIQEVFLYSHSGRDLTEYGQRLEKAIADPRVKVVQCSTAEELAAKSDIICTTTPSATPVLPNDKELLRGKCIIAIGSYTPDMREIPDAVMDLVDRVYVELPYACEESGDLSQPLAEGRLKKEQVILMSDFLASGGSVEEAAEETTYFKSVGMGLFDICIAQRLLKEAKER